jgi:subtilase family serine protease
MRISFGAIAPLAVMALLASTALTHAETPRLVTAAVSDAHTVSLSGNTRPEVTTAKDLGPVADSMALTHMQLLLRRPPATEAAFTSLIDDLHNPHAPSFHHWLTAAQVGAGFGPNPADIEAVVTWLQGHGFTVGAVPPSRMMIDFSGTAGQVREAFGTAIHALDVKGVRHIANMTDPKVPAALAGVVQGVVSLHDFRPHPLYKPRPSYTFGTSSKTYAVAPADLATIYNLTPLFTAGITGTGQTVVLIEDTNVYNTANWKTFRKTFGLSKYTGGKLTQVHPAPVKGGSNCGNPGVLPGNEVEATLDVEWASAAAPNATMELASCTDTETTFGGLIAVQNLIDATTPPTIISISYGECEPYNGAAANAAYNTTYEQAVSEGVSVFVASGDSAAASCDDGNTAATHGITVSAFTSTPYNVSVGGTDFGDFFANDISTYWASTNSKTYGSALSYIPEIPWNDSCAGALVTAYLGESEPYGSSGTCNNSNYSGLVDTIGGSGGPSGCATGAPSVAGVVSGTCKGYAKPSWQSIVGNPSDKVRDIPDVALFASNGFLSHYYIFCDTDGSDGVSCSGKPDTWSGAGGTSFASPIMAAIQALVNEKQGGAQGNPNTVYYALAKTEYGKSGSTNCNSTLGNGVASTCIFYDVTKGDMDLPCEGKYDCYLPSGTYGVLSTSTKKDAIAYGTGVGWDFSTGIGSVNATNLVNNW